MSYLSGYRTDSGLRRLVPKPLASNHAVHSLAPPPLALQGSQQTRGNQATNETGMAADSTGPSDPAQRGADCVTQASIAGGFTGLPSQTSQNGGVETPASSNPKASMYRVQKSGTYQAKAPKTVTACENCRSVMSSTAPETCSYVDTNDESRHSRMKCSGEVPSCDRCLRKGEQCRGYPPRKSTKKRRRAAVARDRSPNIPTDAPLPVPEDHSTDHQVLAPQNNASNIHVGEDLQQNVTTNSSISRDEVGTDSMDAQRNYLLSLFHYLDEPQENEQGERHNWKDIFTSRHI